MVSAEEQEISVHQMIEKELCPTRQVESGFQWRRRQVCELCDGVWKKEPFGKGKKEKLPGKGPKNLEGNSQERGPSTFEGRTHQAKRWRVQKKRMEEKWRKRKKNKKHKRRR